MYQCAGICYSRRSRVGMACVIRLSEPLLKLRSRKDLIETLLHEMIHAWNFIRGISEENGGHGQNFLAKMHEINSVAGTNISVYHTFIDEVNLYKRHWWRCDGVCKNRAPYYGFVKRTSNRAPGKNDLWWKQHEQTCGGNFIKVKEPEKVVKKKGNKENKKKAIEPPSKKVKTPAKTSPGTDIRKFFKPDTPRSQPIASPSTNITLPDINPSPPTSGGFVLGGPGNGRSRLLDLSKETTKETEPKMKKKRKVEDSPERAGPSSSDVIVIDDDFVPPSSTRKPFQIDVKYEFEDDDDIILIDGEFDDEFPTQVSVKAPEKPKSEMCQCPCCSAYVETAKINDHLDQCLGMS